MGKTFAVSLVFVACLFGAALFFWAVSESHPASLTPIASPPPPLIPSATLETRLTSFKLHRTLLKSDIKAATAAYLHKKHLGATSPQTDSLAHYHLSYEVEIEPGEWVPVKAQIFVPETDQPLLPVLVFGAGTSGLADACAPSLEKVEVSNIGNYTNQMIAHAAQGFVVIFPDYEGFHNRERVQGYFVSHREAVTLLSALQTVLEINDHPPVSKLDRNNVFLAGYSQGAHAALAAASQRALLAEPVKIKGVVGYASASNIKALLQESPRLAPMIVYSYLRQYGQTFDAGSILDSRWLTNLDSHAHRLCIDQVFTFYPNQGSVIYTEAFDRALRIDEVEKVAPNFDLFIEENNDFSTFPTIPLFLAQGGTDPIVTATTQRHNWKAFCEQGIHVWYQEYPEINHFQTRQAAFTDTVEWMKQLARDQPVESNCATQ